MESSESRKLGYRPPDNEGVLQDIKVLNQVKKGKPYSEILAEAKKAGQTQRTIWRAIKRAEGK